MLRILPSLAEAFDVELATLRSGGALEGDVPSGMPVHRIDSLAWVTAGWRLRRLIAAKRPGIVLGFQEAANIPLLAATGSIGRSARPLAVISTQSAPSVVLADARPRTRWRLTTAMRRLYPKADRLIAPSEGVARDLSAIVPRAAARVRVVHNAGIDAAVTTRAREPWTHRFLTDGVPILVAAGRLTEQKDYPTLVGAIARLRARREVRAIVLGDGPLRTGLEALARELGVSDVLDLAGYVANPYPAMARADVYVLSSRSEGFGNVLAEALALGVPIVATDCPHGPGEILDRGRYGMLVPPGDPDALAAAIGRMLDDRQAARTFADAGPTRAREFTAERSGAGYVKLLHDLGPRPS